MLTIHTSNGLTAKVDLQDEAQVRAWLGRFADPAFQSGVTGFTVSHKGVQYSVPRPVGFRSVQYAAEHVGADGAKGIRGGERVECFADDVRITMMVHREQRAARVSLYKIGRRRYDPRRDS